MPTFCYITIHPISIATWGIFVEKCSHEQLSITLAALHKQKSDPSLTWIHLAILWHHSKLPTTVSSHHIIYPATAKVWKVTASVKALHRWKARWVLHSPCYFYSWSSKWWKMQEANGQQLDKNPPTTGKDEVVSKLSKSNEGSSINISKWHPWFLLKGNKRFSWTYFLNTRGKLPLYCSISGSRPSPSV